MDLGRRRSFGSGGTTITLTGIVTTNDVLVSSQVAGQIDTLSVNLTNHQKRAGYARQVLGPGAKQVRRLSQAGAPAGSLDTH